MATENDREPEPLDRLVRVLGTIEDLLAAGRHADRERVREWACDLAWAVGTDPVDLRAAARACGPGGIQYLGYDYDSHTEVLYRDALLYYECLYEVMHGYVEDRPSGDLADYGRDEEVADEWPRLLPRLRKAVAQPFPPGELQRVAELARRELARGKDLPPPGPVPYDTARARTDGLTEKSRRAQRAKLADSRVGDKSAGAGAGFTDVLTFRAGEPADRFVTKVGGLPYRPASLPWPTREDGVPLSFLGQVCFADADDLVSVPDDVLLIFAVEPHGYTAGPDSAFPGLRFAWYPLGLTRLVEADAVPDAPWKLLPCHATCERRPEADGPWEGSKIGGEPFVIQDEYATEGEFLAALGQLRLSVPAKQQRAGYEALSLDDDGLLNLYADGNDLEWDCQSY